MSKVQNTKTSRATMSRIRLVCITLSILILTVRVCQSVDCEANDFEYRYTECDSADERWRVAVPKANASCDGGVVPVPTRAKPCSFSCSAGQYLRMDTQNCENCAAGTYSLGNGARFEDFDQNLPSDFTIMNEPPMTISAGQSAQCTKNGGWQVYGDALAYMPSNCTSSLTLTATLKHQGEVMFQYRLPNNRERDLMFEVSIQNDQCHSLRDSYETRKLNRKLSHSSGGDWHEGGLSLGAGRTLINWEVMALSQDAIKRMTRPILIARIDVTGLAASSSCTKCPQGSYSSGQSAHCTPCAINRFADKRGATECSVCPADKYSGYGAWSCEDRPACTVSDYYSELSVCDEHDQMEVSYKWVEPSVCKQSDPKSVKLPASTTKSCPKCPLAMHKNKKNQCSFCDLKTDFVNSTNECMACPPTTVPELGYFYSYWPQMMPHMSASCFLASSQKMDSSGCADVDTWMPVGNRLHTAHPRHRDMIFQLNLKVAGFKDPLLSGEPSVSNPIGHVSFVFSTTCKGDCTFAFAEKSVDMVELNIIETWNSSIPRRVYRHAVTHSRAAEYVWLFVRSGAQAADDEQIKYFEDEASIYSVNVTNTIDGGAFQCRPCPIQDAHGVQNSCVPCEDGAYIDANTHKCVVCPDNHELNASSSRIGLESCVKCGPHLESKRGKPCSIDGQFELEVDGDLRKYDMSKLKDRHFEVSGVKVYGQQGSVYYHAFNATLFGSEPATCKDMYDRLESKESGKSVMVIPDVSAWFCRSTALPFLSDNGTREVIYVTPNEIGSRLVAITSESHYGKIHSPSAHRRTIRSTKALDVNFFYSSLSEPTEACVNGQAAVITARCDQAMVNRTGVSLPDECPDGTCDGCTYQMIITSAAACPLCTEADYQKLPGECVDGWQQIHFIPAKHCVLSGADKEHQSHTVACQILGVHVQLAIGLASALGVLLCVSLIIVMRRSKRIEYKYMKLIENSGQGDNDGYGPGGQLPMAESCALDEDEDDSDDAGSKVIFTRSSKSKGPKTTALFGNKKEKQALAYNDGFEDA